MHDPRNRSTVSRRGTRALAWGVLVAAVLQVAAPVVTIFGPGTSPGAGAGAELLITPAGWAFSIWGVIYALALIQAVAVLVRQIDAVPPRLQVDQLMLYLGGALWILMAALDSSVATAAALLLMFVAAVDGVLTAARRPLTHRWFAVLTRASVGLYAGWVTAAFFLNVSTALVATDVVEVGDLSWQLVVLVIAALTLLVLTVAARGVVAYAIAGCWALLGIAVTGVTQATAAVTALAAGSAVLLVAATAVVRLRGRQPPVCGV